MSDRDPYSRIYHSVVDDPKFVTIFDNNDHLATWLRLLIAADQAHPASAILPLGTKRASVAALVEAKIVSLGTGSRYRIRGLDAERERRQEENRNGGHVRAASAERDTGGRFLPSGGASALPAVVTSGGDQRNQPDEKRREETSQAEQDARDLEEPEGEALTWLARHGCYIRPGNGYHAHLVTTVEQHGINAVLGMLDRLSKAGTLDGDTKGFVFGARDMLNPRVDLRAVEAEIRSEEREEVRRHRQPDPLLESIKAGIIERYGPEEREGPGVAS